MGYVFAANHVADSSVSYLFQVQALAPSESLIQEQREPSNMPQITSSWTLFVSVGIFFLVFAAAMGIQIMGKVKERASMVTMLGLALFLASTPFLLSSLQHRTQTRTNAGPEEVPRQVKVRQTNPTSLSVTWHTDALLSGAVRIGASPLDRKNALVFVADSGQMQKSHTVNIEKLTAGQLYEIEILSGSTWYRDNATPIRVLLPL